MIFELIKTAEDVPDVFYETEGSSGIDLKAYLRVPILLHPLERCVVPTGYKAKFDPNHGFEGQIRSKSGLAAKHGICVLNSPGTIDSDYEGEIKVILYNSDPNHSFTILPEMKIAQLVLASVTLRKEEYILKKSRGDGGFGSTGV